MNFATIFSFSSVLVMPLWFLMAVLPKWSVTRRIMSSPWSIAPVALLYAALVVPAITDLLPSLASPTLDGIRTVLASNAGATIGWIHFLAFDLFVGRWAYLESRERNYSPFIMAPILFFILMFGPLGFVTYLAVRMLLGGAASEPLAQVQQA